MLRIFVNGSRKALEHYQALGIPCGLLVNPYGGLRAAGAIASRPPIPWGMDNGVVTARGDCPGDYWKGYRERWPFGPFWDRVRRMAERPAEDRALLKFVVLPDVLRQGVRTLNEFLALALYAKEHFPQIPVALATQDGIERARELPLAVEYADALFVAGSDEFRQSGFLADLVGEFRARGRYLHMGRVNSIRRIELAASLGCDSVDGTGITFHTRSYSPLLVRHFAAS
jgi:hypothetical protein